MTNTIPTSTFLESRVALLKRMHEMMMMMNNEDCYFTWIMIVPDEPTDEDFESIATSDSEWDYVLNLFEKLFHQYRDDE